jgi:hypothetical protein
MVTKHENDPFHRILKWNGYYFEGVTLSALGITLPIRHPDGSRCPGKGIRSMLTVIHINGFHNIEVQYCTCLGSPPFSAQLFLSQLFSASLTLPKTLFTFECLESFRLLTLEGKLSAYAYMQTLVRITTDEYVGAWNIKVSTYNLYYSALSMTSYLILGSCERVPKSSPPVELPPSTQAVNRR